VFLLDIYSYLVIAQAKAFAVENSAKKVCLWGVRPTGTPFLLNLLPRLSSYLICG
jgi:hypothetical protein